MTKKEMPNMDEERGYDTHGNIIYVKVGDSLIFSRNLQLDGLREVSRKTEGLRTTITYKEIWR